MDLIRPSAFISMTHHLDSSEDIFFHSESLIVVQRMEITIGLFNKGFIYRSCIESGDIG